MPIAQQQSNERVDARHQPVKEIKLPALVMPETALLFNGLEPIGRV